MTAPGPRKIKLSIGGVTLEAELKSNKTADEILAALPVDAPVNVWGEEFYFKLPGVKDYRETATTQVKIGDIAFWGVGQVLAIFFGRTPMSTGPEPVPADRVNVVGRILGDAAQLKRVMDATRIRIEQA
ncbi:cyclophilin-like fold protein [Candidatus Nitrospira bockiana]